MKVGPHVQRCAVMNVGGILVGCATNPENFMHGYEGYCCIVQAQPTNVSLVCIPVKRIKIQKAIMQIMVGSRRISKFGRILEVWTVPQNDGYKTS